MHRVPQITLSSLIVCLTLLAACGKGRGDAPPAAASGISSAPAPAPTPSATNGESLGDAATPGIATSADTAAGRLPATLAEWRARATLLVANTDRPPLLGVDAADRWLMFGDTLAVGFDRAASTVTVLAIRTDAANGRVRGVLKTFGRRGAGPLEYSSTTSIGEWTADSILLMDSGQSRGTVLDISRGTGRTFSYASIDSAVQSDLVGRIGRRGMVFRAYRNNTERGSAGMYRADGLLRVLDVADGKELARSTFAGPAGVRFSIGSAHSNSSAPISLAPLFAVQSSRVVWLPGGSDSLFALSEHGGSGFVGRLAIPIVLLTASDRQNVRARFLSRFRNDPPQMTETFQKYLAIQRSVSTAGSLWAGTHESIWIRLNDVGTRDEGSVWLQLLRDWTIGRCIAVKPAMRLLAFGDLVALVAEQSAEDDGTFEVRTAAMPTGCASGAAWDFRRFASLP